MSITSQGLHILNGQSAGGTFVAAFGQRERLLIQCDMLSCGPTPRCQDLTEWERIRLDFLNGESESEEPWSFRDFEYDLLGSAQRLAGQEDAYIWVGTTVEDQLLIAFTLYLIEMMGGDPERLHLIQFESLPGNRVPILGLGMLNPQQMRSHPPPKRLPAVQREEYSRAWAALTADTPDSLVSFCGREDTSTPYLRDALRAMLRRYPDAGTGLINWDGVLLKQVRERGPRAARVIGYTIIADLHDVDWIGDLYVYRRLLRLAEDVLPQPLVSLSGPSLAMRDTNVALTHFGAAILDGQASFHPTNPIDEWIGGVHLMSAENRLWFLDQGRLVVG